MHRLRLLLVEDSPGHIRASRAAFGDQASIRVARSSTTALETLRAESFDGLVISATLGGVPRTIVDVLEAARALRHPVLVLGRGTRDVEGAASWYATMTSDRPISAAVASRYLHRVGRRTTTAAATSSVATYVLGFLEELRDRAGLTATQTDVLLASVFGETREDLRERLGVSDATLRKHVSATLMKAGAVGMEAPSLDRLIASLYLRATMASLEGE